MLDIDTTSENALCGSMSMPFDFSSYILSVSPPPSSFDFTSVNIHLKGRSSPLVTSFQSCSKEYGMCELNRHQKGALKSIILKPEVENDLANTYSHSDSDSTPTSPCSPGDRSRKQVSFADNHGKPLAEVRLMVEKTEDPPAQRSDSSHLISPNTLDMVVKAPPLTLNFSQPASEYLAFRDKIEQNSVSLENVLLNEYTVLGTIKVKNLSFEKRVFVRHTVNYWDTHCDTDATFIPGPGDIPGRPSCHDTFQFSFQLHATTDRSMHIQFAVCYETLGVQYWDSNGGENYVIVGDAVQEPTVPRTTNDNNNNNGKIMESRVFGSSNLTHFACWRKMDKRLAYYWGLDVKRQKKNVKLRSAFWNLS